MAGFTNSDAATSSLVIVIDEVAPAPSWTAVRNIAQFYRDMLRGFGVEPLCCAAAPEVVSGIAGWRRIVPGKDLAIIGRMAGPHFFVFTGAPNIKFAVLRLLD